MNIITFGHGVGVGWLSPTLTKIQGPDTPLDFQVNIDEISWLGSMLGLGSLCGNLTVAILLERMGRKFCIYLLAVPYAVSIKTIVKDVPKLFNSYSVYGSSFIVPLTWASYMLPVFFVDLREARAIW